MLCYNITLFGLSVCSAMSFQQCSHDGKTSCLRPSSRQVRQLIRQAELLCEQRGLRFTILRKRVLTLICESDQPPGAYQLLESLKHDGRSAAPPTIYRALDFLMEQGLIHRLASNNTYLACAHPQHNHEAVFLVCSHCGNTQEVHATGISRSVKKQAASYDFNVEHTSVEVSGVCVRCS